MGILWLQRHARPLVPAGQCYGRSDLVADAHATVQAAQAMATAWHAEGHRPMQLWHSPLQRCQQLAHALQSSTQVSAMHGRADLVEMDFGTWEGRPWDDIALAELDAWTTDFWAYAPGHGESLSRMMERVSRALARARTHIATHQQPLVWITHAGVIQCVHWLVTRRGDRPSAKEWPSIHVGYGEWICLPLR